VLKVRLVVALAAMSVVTLLPPSVEARSYPPDVQAARSYALNQIGSAQFRCLHLLWERESHWNPKAHNRRSGAHGIPQSLPGRKMAKFGKDWWSNPTVQVKWGLYYIKHRYGTACKALNHAYRTGWY
jgi:hypothetical protein